MPIWPPVHLGCTFSASGSCFNSIGIGLAKKLLSLAIKNLENTGFKYFDLHVLENNTKAISLYRDLEFEVVENVDGKLLMRKVL